MREKPSNWGTIRIIIIREPCYRFPASHFLLQEHSNHFLLRAHTTQTSSHTRKGTLTKGKKGSRIIFHSANIQIFSPSNYFFSGECPHVLGILYQSNFWSLYVHIDCRLKQLIHRFLKQADGEIRFPPKVMSIQSTRANIKEETAVMGIFYSLHISYL